MSEQLHAKLRGAAASPRIDDEAAVAELRTRARRRRAGAGAALAAAALVAVVGGSALAGMLPGTGDGIVLAPGGIDDGRSTVLLPAAGEVSAATLDDGSPVFVAHHEDGTVDVLSPVSTHLGHLVGWCADDEQFVEPIGATFYDRRGRYITGPAPTGLARYEVERVPDGAHGGAPDGASDGAQEVVVVGAMGQPPLRWERPDRIPRPPDSACAAAEGTGEHALRTEPEPAEPLAPDEVGDQHVGLVVHMEGTIDHDQDPPRLCALGREACEAGDPQVVSAWFPDRGAWLDGLTGFQEGRWLVRVEEGGSLSALADATDRPYGGASPYRRDLGTDEDAYPPSTRLAATVTAVDPEAGTIDLAGIEVDRDPQGIAPDSDPARLPLAATFGAQYFPDDRTDSAPFTTPDISPEELAELIDLAGGLAAEITMSADGVRLVLVREAAPGY